MTRSAYAAVLLMMMAGGGELASAQETALTWHDFDEALRRAAGERKPVFVYVRAPWCGPCYRVETDVLPELIPSLSGFVAAKIDLSDRPDPGHPAERRGYEWVHWQGLNTPPAFAVLSPRGETMAVVRGFAEADLLRQALSLAESTTGSSSP